MQVHRAEKVADSTSQLYELVNDVESYPKFLPWCPKAEVLVRGDNEVTARLTLARAGLQTSFTTRNVLQPGERIDMHLQDGPFKKLHGTWTFTEEEDGCIVALNMDFQVSGPLRLLGFSRAFAEACDRMVHAFVVEAERRRK